MALAVSVSTAYMLGTMSRVPAMWRSSEGQEGPMAQPVDRKANVLVVGAGPTGLVMAAELVQRSRIAGYGQIPANCTSAHVSRINGYPSCAEIRERCTSPSWEILPDHR